jgi:hypothetical protein
MQLLDVSTVDSYGCTYSVVAALLALVEPFSMIAVLPSLVSAIVKNGGSVP